MILALLLKDILMIVTRLLNDCRKIVKDCYTIVERLIINSLRIVN